MAALPITAEQRVELTRSIDSMRALLATQGGRSADALQLLPDEPPAEREMAAVFARAQGWARYRTGDAAGALETAMAAWERESGGDDAEGLLHPAGDLMVAALASLELGRPAEARELAARGRDVSVEQGVGFQAAWLAWAVATIDLITGYAEDAAGAFRELVATAARSGFGQVERLASLGMVECCALTGDAAGRARVDGARRVAASGGPCLRPAQHPGLRLARRRRRRHPGRPSRSSWRTATSSSSAASCARPWCSSTRR